MALWDIYQELQIRDAKAQVRSSDELHTSRAARTQDRVDRNEDRFERLLLITEAVWELASEKLGITDAELRARIHEIDVRGTGQADGRRGFTIARCTSCDAAIEKGRATCLYCEAPAPTLDAFDSV